MWDEREALQLTSNNPNLTIDPRFCTEGSMEVMRTEEQRRSTVRSDSGTAAHLHNSLLQLNCAVARGI